MLDHCQQRPPLYRSVRLARTRTANLVVHRPIHGFVPTPTTVLRAKAIASTAPARPPSDQRCGQFPIALAAPSVPYPPRFRALALFGRRPPERVVGIVGAGVRKPAQQRTPAVQKDKEPTPYWQTPWCRLCDQFSLPLPPRKCVQPAMTRGGQSIFVGSLNI